MPRKKGTTNGTVNNNGRNGNSGTRSNVEWKWHNIKLSDEDIEYLSHSDATLEYLATSIVALADNGIGVKIEPTDEGKSVRATVYGPYLDYDTILVGVSAYSGTVRDALLAVLYKFDHYLGGSFANVVIEGVSESAKSRFR